MVKEDHILELELKQVVKKLKEDPRIVMMWEEQDQADQRISVNSQDNLFFKERNKRQNLPNCKECHPELTSLIKGKANEENFFKKKKNMITSYQLSNS